VDQVNYYNPAKITSTDESVEYDNNSDYEGIDEGLDEDSTYSKSFHRAILTM